ncbi:DAO domain-containing protein, partial [Durusdinium trenchii]
VLATLKDRMAESSAKGDVAFSQSDQYKTAGDHDGDADHEGTEGPSSKKPPKNKKGKMKGSKKMKKKKAVLNGKFAAGTRVSQEAKSTNTYQAGDYKLIQRDFIEKFQGAAKLSGKKASFAQAQAAWATSLDRARILSSLSVAELKKRKFVEKGCSNNPFLARVRTAEAGGCLDGVVLDQSYSEEAFMDLITPSGIALAVSQILRVKPGGFVLLALVCSSFSVMWSPQPASNVEVLNRVYRTMFYMGRFGKNTPKRHILWSNNSGLLDQVFQKAGYMSRAEQAALKDSLVKPYTDKNGQRRFVGIKSKLKDSQTCTDDFGLWLASA